MTCLCTCWQALNLSTVHLFTGGWTPPWVYVRLSIILSEEVSFFLKKHYHNRGHCAAKHRSQVKASQLRTFGPLVMARCGKAIYFSRKRIADWPLFELTDSINLTHLRPFAKNIIKIISSETALCMSGFDIRCHILSTYLTSPQCCVVTQKDQQRSPATTLVGVWTFRDSKRQQHVTVRVLSRRTKSAERGCIRWPDTDSRDQCGAAFLIEWTGSQGRIRE